MPNDNEYTLQDLADLADVTPRTIRYYVAQGLLPSPDRVGPGAVYSPGHLDRLRLIRRLQREHMPLADIRLRLGSLDDRAVRELAEASPVAPPSTSASDYIRTVLAGAPLARRLSDISAPATYQAIPIPALSAAPQTAAQAPDLLQMPGPGPTQPTETPVADRSQWDRIALIPDVELHVRRPLSRRLNKQVERLIAIARQLLEEDPS
jgi:DNA-binding transcriptional MerR regulator